MANSLNPRQKNVLTALVDHYIVKAEPVSSKILSQSPILSASSATIRNTMAELEDLGMVEQPHASAGRLPTDRGYRVYVDELMYPEPLAISDKTVLDLLGAEESHEAKVVKAAKTLADMTQLLGLVIPPDDEQVIFRKISLVRVEEDKIVVVVTGSNDEARSLLVESGSEVSFYRLEAVIQKLNLEMKGKPVSFLNDILNDKMDKSASKDDIQALDVLGRSILKLSKNEGGDDVIVHGIKNLMNRPDFTKINDFEAIMDLLDSKITLVHFLRQKGNTRTGHKQSDAGGTKAGSNDSSHAATVLH